MSGNRRATIFVIFGAPVLPGGVPSRALRRRVRSALAAAEKAPSPRVIVTGGIVRHPPAEAELMRKLLVAAGIPGSAIALDDQARNTVQSARNVARMINALPDACNPVFVIMDTYHQWRCRALLHLFGIATTRMRLASGIDEEGYWRWGWYYLREVLAAVKDIPVALAYRRSARRDEGRWP